MGTYDSEEFINYDSEPHNQKSDEQSLNNAAERFKNKRVRYTGSAYFDTYSLKAAFKAGAMWAKENKIK